MAVYLIVEAKEVMDKQQYGEYIRNVPQTIERYGGKYCARGGRVTSISGDWNPARIIIVEFESMNAFDLWWNSPEYKSVAPLREQSAKVNAIVVEGV